MDETLRDDPGIGGDQVVLRRVSERSYSFDENLGRFRPSSQAFLQNGPDGLVSVYLQSETTHSAVAAEGPEPYLAAIPVGELRELGLGIVRDPSSGGPGHCEITGRKTRGILNRIAKQAQWVPGYAPPGTP